MTQTYVDALGAVMAWINSRTATLVGIDKPLQKGAHVKYVPGAAVATFALLEEQQSTTRSDDSPESPDMMAVIAAQVYGGTRKAATDAAVALAEELSTALCGCAATVPGALLWVADDITGPGWAPDGDVPRLLVTFTVRVRPL